MLDLFYVHEGLLLSLGCGGLVGIVSQHRKVKRKPFWQRLEDGVKTSFDFMFAIIAILFGIDLGN